MDNLCPKKLYHFHPFQDDVDTLGLKQERTDFIGQIQILELVSIIGPVSPSQMYRFHVKIQGIESDYPGCKYGKGAG